MNKPTHDYIATDKKCGCIVGLIADVPGHEKDTAKTIQEFIGGGCFIERVARESEQLKEALANFGHHCQPEQPALF